MDETTGGADPDEEARAVATDPSLPGWAVEVRDRLLAADDDALRVLERLHSAAPWLYGKGQDWLSGP